MVYTHRGHTTIDGFWGRYHLEFQDVYDRFSLWSISAIDYLQEHYGFTGKRVLDIGTGTGLTAFRIAQDASSVVSIDPYPAMRDFTIRKQEKLGIKNVRVLEGVG